MSSLFLSILLFTYSSFPPFSHLFSSYPLLSLHFPTYFRNPLSHLFPYSFSLHFPYSFPLPFPLLFSYSFSLIFPYSSLSPFPHLFSYSNSPPISLLLFPSILPPLFLRLFPSIFPPLSFNSTPLSILPKQTELGYKIYPPLPLYSDLFNFYEN